MAAVGKAALKAIKTALKCYAAKLHFNRGANILKPNRKLNKGHAQTFEQVTDFPGRMAAAANWKDTLGQDYPEKPWMIGLPSTIFISDMGDALCSESREQFDFLEQEVIANVLSEKGLRHLWLWLSKRPAIMAAFAERIGGMPVHLCAMTTVTGPQTLGRVDQLRKVKAPCRGLSIEPLWDRIPPEGLNLTGIDWVIVGGESGARDVVDPFHVEWALELREQCRKAGVAFFVKQLGSRPFMNGKPLVLADRHGGDWDEWPRPSCASASSPPTSTNTVPTSARCANAPRSRKGRPEPLGGIPPASSCGAPPPKIDLLRGDGAGLGTAARAEPGNHPQSHCGGRRSHEWVVEASEEAHEVMRAHHNQCVERWLASPQPFSPRENDPPAKDENNHLRA